MTAPTADAVPTIGSIAPRPAVPWVRIAVGIVVTIIAIRLPYYYSPETNQIFSKVLYLAIAAMGLNLLTGFNGQVSIGHGAFFGVGAFTSAILVVNHGWYLEATIPVAAVLAALLGVLVGFPALRVKGLYLALITLGLAVLFPSVVKKYVHGPGGIPLLRPSRLEVQSLISSIPDDIYQYYVCLGVLVLTFLLAANLMRSRTGRAIIAVRDQEVAASTVGVDVARVKVLTFALSAAYAGVAGSLSVLIERSADASNPLIYFQDSIEFLIAVVIGGAATITGPLLGAMLLVAIQKRTEGTDALAPALLGGALIAVVYVLPEGIVGGYRRAVVWARRRRGMGSSGDDPPASASAPEPPSSDPDLPAAPTPSPT
ncbi:MAG: branched-chain amino acid transporter permease [Acidimicrobiales bacterium]|nr:branched-chain amino acid transporter permease [Acidimicrobiales bacterium]